MHFILDDASRKILAGGEFRTINTENSIIFVDQMIWNYWWLCPMRELTMDHGTGLVAIEFFETTIQMADPKLS